MLEQLRGIRPVLFCSGWTASEVAGRLNLSSRTAFIPKPFRGTALTEAVARLPAGVRED